MIPITSVTKIHINRVVYQKRKYSDRAINNERTFLCAWNIDPWSAELYVLLITNDGFIIRSKFSETFVSNYMVSAWRFVSVTRWCLRRSFNIPTNSLVRIIKRRRRVTPPTLTRNRSRRWRRRWQLSFHQSRVSITAVRFYLVRVHSRLCRRCGRRWSTRET